MILETATLSDRGRVRENNEDAVLSAPLTSERVAESGFLCVVADGLGGQAAGEVASQLAVTTVHDVFYGIPSRDGAHAMREAIAAANLEIWQEACRDQVHAGMGCTLTAALIRNDRLIIGHAGDSRAYLVRQDQISQITTDHSWVALQVAGGLMSREQAEVHPHRNVLMRALGQDPFLEIDIYQQRLEHQDRILICTDGLTSVVREEEIGEIVRTHPPEEAVRMLVDHANQRGGPDNITVALIRARSASRSWPRR